MAKAGRGSDQFPLRLPDGLRDQIKARADNNGRSMNAEIVDRLEKSLRAEELAQPDVTAHRSGVLASLPDTALQEILSNVATILNQSLDRERELAGKVDKLAETVSSTAAANEQILEIVRSGRPGGKTDVGS